MKNKHSPPKKSFTYPLAAAVVLVAAFIFSYVFSPLSYVFNWLHQFDPWRLEELLVVGTALAAVLVINWWRCSKERSIFTKSREVLHRIADTASDAIISADRQANIIFWNKAAERIFGYTSSEVLGKSVILIVPQRLRKQYKTAFHQAGLKKDHGTIKKRWKLPLLEKMDRSFP